MRIRQQYYFTTQGSTEFVIQRPWAVVPSETRVRVLPDHLCPKPQGVILINMWLWPRPWMLWIRPSSLSGNDHAIITTMSHWTAHGQVVTGLAEPDTDIVYCILSAYLCVKYLLYYRRCFPWEMFRMIVSIDTIKWGWLLKLQLPVTSWQTGRKCSSNYSSNITW